MTEDSSVAERPKHFGKKRKVGTLFEATTKPVSRYRYSKGCTVVKERIYRKGDKDYFVKGKRRYFCEVMGISRTTVFREPWSYIGIPGLSPNALYWQFTYVVKILEN